MNTLNRFGLLAAAAFVALYLAYSPAANIPYASHDSIRFFHKFFNHEADAQVYSQYRFEFDLGRPLTAVIESGIFKNTQHLADLSHFRLLSIFILALSSALLAACFESGGLPWVSSFCLSVAICTLPGVQDFIFVPYVGIAVGALLSSLAALVFMRPTAFHAHLWMAGALVAASFCLYPPTAFFFLTPTGVMIILGPDWQALKKSWMYPWGLWLAAAGTYYVISKIFLAGHMHMAQHDMGFGFKDVLTNIARFPARGLPQIFNFWNVYYSPVLGFIGIGLVGAFIMLDAFSRKQVGLKQWLAWMAILLSVSSVWFFFGGYMPRQFITAQALALGLVFWCGQWLIGTIGTKTELFKKLWPVAIAVFALIVTNRMINSNVMNNYSELMFVRSRVVQYVNSQTPQIHVIFAKDRNEGYNGLPRVYDNINSTTPGYEIPDLLRVALKDIGQPFDLHCIVTYSDYGQPFKVLPRTVVIDMNDLVNIMNSSQAINQR